MSYRVKEVFRTLQGEGYWTGTPAIFVRLVGCNLWTGVGSYRTRDAARTGARCPEWCDTDFQNGDLLDAERLVGRVHRLALESSEAVPLLVFTGGEPLLQLDIELLGKFRSALPSSRLAIETNGTLAPNRVLRALDWVCLSPKQECTKLALREADELKVVFPAYDPLEYEDIICRHRFVQPQAPTEGQPEKKVLAEAVAFCLDHPSWRLSTQTHKWLEIP